MYETVERFTGYRWKQNTNVKNKEQFINNVITDW
jgi:hypothetical protein